MSDRDLDSALADLARLHGESTADFLRRAVEGLPSERALDVARTASRLGLNAGDPAIALALVAGHLERIAERTSRETAEAAARAARAAGEEAARRTTEGHDAGLRRWAAALELAGRTMEARTDEALTRAVGEAARMREEDVERFARIMAETSGLGETALFALRKAAEEGAARGAAESDARVEAARRDGRGARWSFGAACAAAGALCGFAAAFALLY